MNSTSLALILPVGLLLRFDALVAFFGFFFGDALASGRFRLPPTRGLSLFSAA